MILWRVSKHTYERFWQLLRELEHTPEYSEQFFILSDEIKRLPGYPHWARERDDIKPEIYG